MVSLPQEQAWCVFVPTVGNRSVAPVRIVLRWPHAGVPSERLAANWHVLAVVWEVLGAFLGWKADTLEAARMMACG